MQLRLIFYAILLGTFCVFSCKPKSSSEFPVDESDDTSGKLFYDLKSILDTANLQEVLIGKLSLPTGKIVAGDPFFVWDNKPFRVKVTPGSYPVKLLIYKVEEEHYRVAFAKIVFADQPATRWKMALSEDVSDENVKQLQEGEIFGYGVDAGLGCFLDEETNKVYDRVMDSLVTVRADVNYYDDVLADEFARSAKHPLSSAEGSWNTHYPIKDDSMHNVIMFSSGWGDGFYATYWGISATGDIVELITDFGVVVAEE